MQHCSVRLDLSHSCRLLYGMHQNPFYFQCYRHYNCM